MFGACFIALSIVCFYKHNFLKANDIVELSYFITLQYSRTEEAIILIEHMTEILFKQMSDLNSGMNKCINITNEIILPNELVIMHYSSHEFLI